MATVIYLVRNSHVPEIKHQTTEFFPNDTHNAGMRLPGRYDLEKFIKMIYDMENKYESHLHEKE